MFPLSLQSKLIAAAIYTVVVFGAGWQVHGWYIAYKQQSDMNAQIKNTENTQIEANKGLTESGKKLKEEDKKLTKSTTEWSTERAKEISTNCKLPDSAIKLLTNTRKVVNNPAP